MTSPEPNDYEDIVNDVKRTMNSARVHASKQKTVEASAAPSHPIDPSLCFVRHLPPELLLRIFSYCKHFDNDTSRVPWWVRSYVGDIDRPWPTVLALSHVCKAWRHVTNSHGSLWTEILVDNNEWTELYIERSRDALLHLSFDPFAERCAFADDATSEPHFVAACSTLDALHRVREIDICGPVNAEVLSLLFTAGSECATDMFIDGAVMLDRDNPEELIPIPNALRILSLKRFETDRHMRLFHAPLTSLSLTRTFCGSPDERLVEPLVELLRQLPTLEHLDVTLPIYEEEDYDILEDPRGPHFPKTPLPNLKSLDIHDELPQAISLIESIELPPNVKLSLVSEAWGDYDREDMIHESATEIPSYDPRLHAILDAQYAAACNEGARFTRLNIMDTREPETTVSAIAIELCDPSSPPLPESVLLTVDCEMYMCRDAGAKTLLRLLPVLPAVDGVRTLELYIDMGVEGWRETSRLLTAITHLTVHTGHALESFLRADQASERPLLPRLECVTLDGCVLFKEWDEFSAFLRRRGAGGGRTIWWQAVKAVFMQTKEEEKELLDKMAGEGFAPLKWCRPRYFEYEKVSKKQAGSRYLRFTATSLPRVDLPLQQAALS